MNKGTGAFWEKVRQALPRKVLQEAVRDYHNETVRRVLAMEGKAGEAARKAVVDTDDGGATMSEVVYAAVGDDAWRPCSALGMACAARRQAYVSEINDPKYDDVEHDRVRVFFKRCRDRALDEMVKRLDDAAAEAGLAVRFGS